MKKKIFFSGLSSGSSFIFQLVILAIISKNFSQTEFGVISVLAAINSFILLFSDFGVNNYLITRKEINIAILKVMSRMVLLLTIFVSAVCLCYVKLSGFSDLVVLGAVLTCANAIILSFSKVNRALLLRESQFKSISIIDSTPRIIILITFLTFFFFNEISNYPVALIYFFPIISLNFISAILYYLSSKNIRLGLVEGNYQLDSVFFKFSLPIFFSSVLNFFTQNLDLLIIAKYMGAPSAGAYTILKQLVMRPIQVVSPSITNVMISRMSQLKRNNLDISSEYNKGLMYITLITVSGYIPIYLLSEQIIEIFFGEQWLELVGLLPIFMLYGLFRANIMPIGSLLSVLNKNDKGLYYTIFQLVVSLPLITLTSLNYGIEVLVFNLFFYQVVLSIFHWFFMVSPNVNVSFVKYHKVLLFSFFSLFILFSGELIDFNSYLSL